MDFEEVSEKVAKHIHNEDFLHNLYSLQNESLKPKSRMFFINQILDLPFLDILLINPFFINWVENTRKKHKIKTTNQKIWKSCSDYKKEKPDVFADTQKMLDENFPKINDFGRLTIIEYLFEKRISPMSISDVLSREPIITASKETDPVTKKEYINIEYAIEEHTAIKKCGLSKKNREYILRQLGENQDYFKKYKSPNHQIIGNRYLLYILKKKLGLSRKQIMKWFKESQLPYIFPDDVRGERLYEEIRLTQESFSHPSSSLRK